MHLVIYVNSIRILRMNFLFRRQPQLSWGAYERKFVHWILCQLVIC